MIGFCRCCFWWTFPLVARVSVLCGPYIIFLLVLGPALLWKCSSLCVLCCLYFVSWYFPWLFVLASFPWLWSPLSSPLLCIKVVVCLLLVAFSLFYYCSVVSLLLSWLVLLAFFVLCLSIVPLVSCLFGFILFGYMNYSTVCVAYRLTLLCF